MTDRRWTERGYWRIENPEELRWVAATDVEAPATLDAIDLDAICITDSDEAVRAMDALVAAVRDAALLHQARQALTEIMTASRLLNTGETEDEILLRIASIAERALLASPAPDSRDVQTLIDCGHPLGEYGRCELPIGHEGDHAGAPPAPDSGEGT